MQTIESGFTGDLSDPANWVGGVLPGTEDFADILYADQPVTGGSIVCRGCRIANPIVGPASITSSESVIIEAEINTSVPATITVPASAKIELYYWGVYGAVLNGDVTLSSATLTDWGSAPVIVNGNVDILTSGWINNETVINGDLTASIALGWETISINCTINGNVTINGEIDPGTLEMPYTEVLWYASFGATVHGDVTVPLVINPWGCYGYRYRSASYWPWVYPQNSPYVAPASAVLSGVSNLAVPGTLQLPKAGSSGGHLSWLGW